MKRIFAVVPAAGSGQRMQSSTPKQYLPIGDAAAGLANSVLNVSLGKLLDCQQIETVMVALAGDDQSWPELPLSQNVRVDTTVGGETRAHSVLNALRALQSSVDPSADDWVLVHDAARPCLSQAVLTRLIITLQDDPVGGILAVPVSDTLKRQAEGHSHVLETMERSGIWQAQTPQMFRFSLLVDALSAALEKGFAITDEASAMEWAQHTVQLVPGDSRNLKVTTPEDLVVASALLALET